MINELEINGGKDEKILITTGQHVHKDSFYIDIEKIETDGLTPFKGKIRKGLN